MTVRRAQQARPPSSGADLSGQLAELVAEAERQFQEGLLAFTAQDAALARRIADDLVRAVGTAAGQERLPVIDRLEDVREALAVIAVGIARTHGQLAWFLARASTVLTPVLAWRSLPADRQRSFGTVVPGIGELADAETAVRRLAAGLTRVGTAGVAPQPGPKVGPDGVGPDGVVPDRVVPDEPASDGRVPGSLAPDAVA
ncbi:hypothetical protein ACFWXO_34195 [Kitasatospora sp. NPDC059088]|uniref:hypothetical protein n=1 Tax=Kitasatospora sp. NPDC059088 TaxID=3346722 RepID=UPI0036977986